MVQLPRAGQSRRAGRDPVGHAERRPHGGSGSTLETHGREAGVTYGHVPPASPQSSSLAATAFYPLEIAAHDPKATRSTAEAGQGKNRHPADRVGGPEGTVQRPERP